MRRATGRTRRCLGRVGEKKGLKEDLAAEVIAEIDALVGAPVAAWDFEAIEVAARREALRIAGLAISRRLNADHSDHAGPWLEHSHLKRHFSFTESRLQNV
jgi:hypothetical protein